MKLYEVISPKTLKADAADFVPTAFHRATNKDNGNLGFLGRGAFAAVFSHKNRPASAFKVGIGDGEDTYLSYIAKVSQNERWKSNPYLPRVHSQKNYKDPGGGASYVVEMEKLVPFMSIEPEEVEAIIDRAFHNLPPGKYADLPRQYDVVEEITSAAQGNTTSIRNIKDKQLLQAIAMISNIGSKRYRGNEYGKRSSGAMHLDIHTSNVMIRRTSVGAQLVITDPLV
jgi:hypothetical protein